MTFELHVHGCELGERSSIFSCACRICIPESVVAPCHVFTYIVRLVLSGTFWTRMRAFPSRVQITTPFERAGHVNSGTDPLLLIFVIRYITFLFYHRRLDRGFYCYNLPYLVFFNLISGGKNPKQNELAYTSLLTVLI